LIWDINNLPGERKIPAVFLDRDGVIIREKDFQCDLETVEFIPGAVQALRNLKKNFLAVVISNQSGVARGYFTEDELFRFQRALDEMLARSNAVISAWYFCPHAPDDGCKCRKPKPGMILRAAEELPIDLPASWMVGDKSSDIGAGKAAGLKTILVRTGYAGQEPAAMDVKPDFVADDLLSAVDIIIEGKT
jgi:D-glycero-D-manno-heptose 1,7-bisphosphate phosphatase